MKISIPHRSAWKFWIGLAVLAVVSGVSTARACTTPVYRYAMYNWASAPYYVFHFHHGEPNADEEAVNKLIAELSEEEESPANVFVEPIDLSQEGRLDRLPKVVKEAFESYEDGEPSHVIFSPWGVELFSGKLDEPTVRSMIDSPTRAKLGKLLEEGNITVLLMLTGKDKKENAKAEKAANELIDMAASGAIPIGFDFAPPPVEKPAAEGESAEGAEDAEEAENPNGIKVALVKLDRDDKAEEWLIRSLLKIEPDLMELADQPMVFAVYGRGRALEPYVGKGITADNLTEVVMFLGEACSCQVKDMNPGADLLMKWDWDATADVLAAEEYGMEEGQYDYDEFTPGGMTDEGDTGESETPADEADTDTDKSDKADAKDAAGDDKGTAADDGDSALNKASPPADETPDAAVALAIASVPSADESGDKAEPPAAAEPAAEPSDTAAAGIDPAYSTEDEPEPVDEVAADEPVVDQQFWTFGLGLGVATVLTLVVGTALIVKQSS